MFMGYLAQIQKEAPMTDFYISPTGCGDKSGSSIENAASINSINTVVTQASGGDRVVLIADQGDYNIAKSINIYSGGDEGKPITIVGMSSTGQEMDATFVSNRAEVYSPTAQQGIEIFRLNEGSNNLVFDNVNFKNVATAFRLGGNLENITIQDSSAENVSRYVENLATGKNVAASVDGLTIRNVEVDGFAKGVVRLQYDSQNVVIDNVKGDSQHIDGASFAIGVHIDGTAHDIVVRNTEIGNITDTTSSYYNGDGFATERGVYNVVFENTRAYNNTDAGYDIKSTSTQLIGAVADGNSRNFRIWATDTVADGIVGLNPTYHGGSSTKPANVWLAAGAHADITNSQFLDDDGLGFLFDLAENGASLAIGGVESNQSATGNSKLTNPVIMGKTASLIGSVEQMLAKPAELHAAKNAILENSAAGTSVAKVSSEGASSFKLSDDAGGMFSINSRTGEIFVANSAGLDYEKAHSFAVSVVASNAQGASTTATFMLELTNVVENQRVIGTGANDRMIFTSADNWTIDGGDGNDLIVTSNGVDRVQGGRGDDTINTGGGDDTITFSLQSNGFDTIDGGTGRDTILADKNNAVIGLHSFTGIEVISGGGKAGIRIMGSADADYLDFSNTVIDRITRPIDLGAGDDVAIGNAQNNSFAGGAGHDIIIGAGGSDVIDGGAGNDWLYGDMKDGSPLAGGGNDTITGGAGDDHLFGGRGDDTFVYSGKGFGHDTIYDFGQANGNHDHIDISGTGLHYSDLSISYGAAGALVQFNSGDSILLKNVASLSASDFIA